jgi:hypothetical protein
MESKIDQIVQMLRTFMFATACLSVFSVTGGASPEKPSEWSRAIQVEPANGAHRGQGLELYHIAQNESAFIGTCLYENNDTQGRKASRVVIEGVKSPEGLFWPDVELGVRKTANGDWQKVQALSVVGTRSSIVIEANDQVAGLVVSLDPFKSFLGSHHLGRIVLKTGEATEFALEYLLAPGREKSEAEGK